MSREEGKQEPAAGCSLRMQPSFRQDERPAQRLPLNTALFVLPAGVPCFWSVLLLPDLLLVLGQCCSVPSLTRAPETPPGTCMCIPQPAVLKQLGANISKKPTFYYICRGWRWLGYEELLKYRGRKKKKRRMEPWSGQGVIEQGGGDLPDSELGVSPTAGSGVFMGTSGVLMTTVGQKPRSWLRQVF